LPAGAICGTLAKKGERMTGYRSTAKDSDVPRGSRVEHSIAIDAPAAIVWEMLADVNDWSRWSPLYASASGTLAVGETLDLAIALPGLKPQPVRATVTAASAGEAIRYLTLNMGGLVKGHRYVEIEPAGATGCVVANGEIMGGLLGPVISAAAGGKVRAGLKAMNEALKARAEARQHSS
jgi:hypothetical protein